MSAGEAARNASSMRAHLHASSRGLEVCPGSIGIRRFPDIVAGPSHRVLEGARPTRPAGSMVVHSSAAPNVGLGTRAARWRSDQARLCTALRESYHVSPTGSPSMFQLHDTVGVMRMKWPGPTIPTRVIGLSAVP